MAKKLRIGVVFGGRSGEHEVSLVSASAVITALDKEKYEVVPIGITTEGRWISSERSLQLLKAKSGLEYEPERLLAPEPSRQALMTPGAGGGPALPLDVVFPVLHGTYGEDGAVQGLLELANIPYVGAGVLGSAVGMDKIAQKQILEREGFPLAKYCAFASSDYQRGAGGIVARVERQLRYPLFVKPANTGSSIGISKAHDRKELKAAIAAASRFDRRIIVEQGIVRPREIECAVLGNEAPVASVLGEIIPSNEFYDYEAKYVDGKSRALIPAPLPRSLASKIRAMAVRAFRAIDCAGMARVDFFLSRKSRRVVLNELNTIPGFTSISMYPKLWEASGMSYSALLDRLIELALERHHAMNRLQRTYTPAKDWYR